MEDKHPEKEQNILYELLTLSEWPQTLDVGLQKASPQSSMPNISFLNPWRFFKKSNIDNKKFLQSGYPWKLAVSQDGKVIAVLQESLLEIRTAKDEFSSVVGKASVPCDQCPQLRNLAWSPDNTYLAVARDNGTVNIYNLLGCSIASIQPDKTNAGNASNTYSVQPVAGLVFLQQKSKSTKWSNELLVIYHNSTVKSILLSTLDGCDFEENSSYSLEHYFHQGITAVSYYTAHHVIIIAGPCNQKEHGISVWRILNDYPYLKVASGFENSIHNTKSLLRFFPGYSAPLNTRTVIKMRISPNGKILACLHMSGEISLWQLPGIHLCKRWSLAEQPDHEKINPETVVNIKDEEYFYPVDISWWSDTALVIARRSGSISVCSTSTLKNLLGDFPEFLNISPQISSFHGSKSSVIALECETESNYGNKQADNVEDNDENFETSVLQASIQAALYSFTDIERFEPKRKTPRLVQRTYRLLALKRTSPEELYARKIDCGDYDSALQLAQTYNLDCDLVYQKQWRTSVVTKESIDEYLDKIKNTYWVLHECVERVPETLDEAKELLQFGLKKTDFNEGLEADSLNSEKKKLISYRRQILLFLDRLFIYQRIIENPTKYDAIEYGQFRRKPSVVNIVEYARQENWEAVSTMFKYGSDEVLKHRLPILSNFPETLPPLRYRSLLPEIVDDKVVPCSTKQLRSPDWSEDEKYDGEAKDYKSASNFIYDSDPSLRIFETNHLTPELLGEWYIRRTCEIEKNTGLVEYALSFATLGKERSIKTLDHLLFNLLTLNTLVYVVQDQEITLSKLEGLTHLEQAKFLISKSTEVSFVKDLINLIYPFALRCENEGFTTFYILLRGLLLSLSEEDLNLPLVFFKYLKGENTVPFDLSLTEIMSLALDCLYACKKSDQLDNNYLILECLPVRGTDVTAEEEKLHDKLDKLEKHLEICEILERYNVSKSLHFILENEENEMVGKELMHDMAKFTMNETLNFSDLLSDLQQLQSTIFTSVTPVFCAELVAFTQMTCECEEIIMSAEDLLQVKRDEPNKIIPLDRSISLVLEASKNHFERAVNYDDICIKLAQACLNLISEPNPLICEELDFIDSLQLLEDFNVKLLPMQVRKCTDKMKLIESCLRAKNNAYQSCQRLLQLAQTLRIYGEDRKRRDGEVLMLIAQHALDSADYAHCSEICGRLVSRNFSIAWPVVCGLAGEEKYQDNGRKKEFFAFSILHCPVENLEKLIESRVKLHSAVFPHKNLKLKQEINVNNNYSNE